MAWGSGVAAAGVPLARSLLMSVVGSESYTSEELSSEPDIVRSRSLGSICSNPAWTYRSLSPGQMHGTEGR